MKNKTHHKPVSPLTSTAFHKDGTVEAIIDFLPNTKEEGELEVMTRFIERMKTSCNREFSLIKNPENDNDFTISEVLENGDKIVWTVELTEMFSENLQFCRINRNSLLKNLIPIMEDSIKEITEIRDCGLLINLKCPPREGSKEFKQIVANYSKEISSLVKHLSLLEKGKMKRIEVGNGMSLDLFYDYANGPKGYFGFYDAVPLFNDEIIRDYYEKLEKKVRKKYAKEKGKKLMLIGYATQISQLPNDLLSLKLKEMNTTFDEIYYTVPIPMERGIFTYSILDNNLQL